MELTTSRLLLREFLLSDFEAVHAYGSDPLVVKHVPWGPNTPEQTREFLMLNAEEQKRQPRVQHGKAIVVAAENRLIGGIGLTLASRHTGVLGYVLHRQYWDRGYATEAARRMLRFGFEDLKLHRIWASVDPDNTASVHVLEKLGMRREAQHLKADWLKDRWRDTFIYAILEDEWRERESARCPNA